MSVQTDRIEKDANLQPGDLNRYIRLTSVSLWLVLGAVLVFVVGLVVWGCLGKMRVTVEGVAVADRQGVVLYVPAEQLSRIKEDSGLEIASVSAVFGEIPDASEAVPAGDVLDEYQRSLAGLDGAEKVVSKSVDVTVPEGSYKAEVILEEIRPISFLFGGDKAK